MKNREVRQGNKQTVRQMSAFGVGYREITKGDSRGKVARILLGKAPTARVITLEQQPDHAPIAAIQDATYRADYLRDGKPDINYRPHGQALNVPVESARILVESAFVAGVLPGGEQALQITRNF